MDTNNKFEKDLIDSSAYKNPEGKKAIDEAIARMHAAEKAGNTGEVEKITLELAEKLTKIAATPEGTLSPEDAEVVARLEKQFGERLDELDAFRVNDKTDPKIIGIDGKEYYVPQWVAVKFALNPDKLKLIGKLEKPILLLVPDGMSLNEYFTGVGGNTTLTGRFPWAKAPDIDLNSDDHGTLIFGASRYDMTNHGGETKNQRLQKPGALGWQVFVVDGEDEVPVDTLGISADDLLADFRAKGFGGLSAEANFALQMHGEIRGKEFDKRTQEMLLESYLTDMGGRGAVMVSSWVGLRLDLSTNVPGRAQQGQRGARRSVRIL